MPQATPSNTDADSDGTSPSRPAVTVHHLDREKCESPEDYANRIADFTRKRWELDEETFEQLYTPVETVLNETSLESAFERSQAFKVAELCDAQHSIRSSQCNDVLELIHEDGSTELYVIDGIGFEQLPFTTNN